ncbi:DUF4347 domain-containing protein [Polyangium sp. 15x6]|uniref:DUF4347 domain-containing protein n=1 Tax=Polyangium sp. 15x6 TaxID=3042687 RepID=UPI00249C4823|nr:DUF4347 domain-containing protein [Polyangium sp. 15x6]MDI3287299.1 DUF4347 domain-containing protein [Polyangium sp. 15x6]
MKLVVFDATDTPRAHVRGAIAEGAAPRSMGLSPIWWMGTWMHRLLRAADATLGARSWEEALAWAASISESRNRAIGSIQFWGHGAWGYMAIGRSRLDHASLGSDHAMAAAIDRLRERLTGPEALFWLRCCSAFGGQSGRAFAGRLASRLGCRVAGHTYVIGFWQSGTHSVRPGESATWSPREGVRVEGERAIGALTSSATEPNTVTCLRVDWPEAW